MATSTRLVLVTAACLLAACSVPAAAPSAPNASGLTSPSATPMNTTSETATEVPTPGATAEAPILAAGGFADVVTTDLIVRSAPGTGGDSEIYGTIANIGVYVLDGPVQADGLEWWLVVPDSYGQLGSDLEGGWVARGAQGEVWLAAAKRNCKAEPRSEELWVMPPTEWVGCYAGMQVTLSGVLMGCFRDALGDWCVLRYCPTDAADNCADVADGRSVTVILDSPPEREEGRADITGHFGDFDVPSERCGAGTPPDYTQLAVFRCATFMIATSYRFAD